MRPPPWGLIMSKCHDDRHPLRLCMPNGSPLSSSLALCRFAPRPAAGARARQPSAVLAGDDDDRAPYDAPGDRDRSPSARRS